MSTSETTAVEPFFVAGGTVPPGSPSYVERAADRELYEALRAGEFCYVLNSRQMGKSSLAVRTISKLEAAGVRTAFIDLTRLGATGADLDRWYSGLLVEIGRALGLRSEAMAYLKANATLPAVARLFGFLRDEALVRIEGPFALMIDEIDAVRSLPFPADDLFAGLRELHNARATDPALRRLTICLLGAALPSDLIVDPRRTPFNVGRRIELRDFSAEEARPFASQVGDEALTRVFYWTGGHPFLTQAICAELSSSPPPSGSSWRGGRGERDVDALVQSRYLDARARESDTNLTDVGRRLLGEGDPNVSDEDRATTLALYERTLRGKPVADDESNPGAARIKMSGIARIENGELRVRNRIYERAFDAAWIRSNMPGQELRRQRKAFWSGVMRTGLISTAVLAVISTLGVIATRNAARATQAETLARTERDMARYDAYVASMQTMSQRDAEGDLTGIRRTLDRLKDDPNRGWEWSFWNRAVDHGATRIDRDGASSPGQVIASPSSPYVAVADRDALTVYDAATGRRLRSIGLPHSTGNSWKADLFRDGQQVFLLNSPGNCLLIANMATGRIVKRRDLSTPLMATPLSVDQWDSQDDRFTFAEEAGAGGAGPRLLRLNLDTLQTTAVPIGNGKPSFDVWELSFEATGRNMACIWNGPHRQFISVLRAVDLQEIHRIRIAATMDLISLGPSGSEVLVDDGQRLVRLSTTTGKPLGAFPHAGTARIGGRYAPDGRRLLLSTGKTVEEVDLAAAPPRILRTVPIGANASYLPNGRLFLDAGSDLMILDTPTSSAISGMFLHGASWVEFCRSADGRVGLTSADRFVTIDADDPLASPEILRRTPGLADVSGRFTLETLGARRKIADLQGLHPPFWIPRTWSFVQTEFAGNPDGTRVVLPGSATHFDVYDATNGTLVARLGGIAFPSAARFSDDRKWLATGDAEGNLTLWDTQSWKQILSARLGPTAVVALAFSNDGTRLAGGMAGGLSVLDLRKGSVVRLSDTSPNVHGVAWSHDGRRLASGGDGRQMRLWDPDTGRDLGVIGAHRASIVGAWFSKDDQTLCSVDLAGTLKRWPTTNRPW